MNRLWLGLVSAIVLIAIGAYFLLRPAPQQPPSPIPVVSAPLVTPPPPTAPQEPAVKHEVALPPGVSELPPIQQAGDFVEQRITELLGKKNVLAHLQMDNFVRRMVATVDNLSRPLAPPSKWPVNPTPGRFSVETGKDGSVIAPANAARYAPFVTLVESVDTAKLVALYRRLYPLFQSAYEGLGYPGKYFNDRLVATIDLLLATPEPAGVLKVEVPEIRGPLKPSRPWVLYQYSDPTLEALSSGQKILLRVGGENGKRLKAKLAQIRKLVATDSTGR